MNDELLDAQSLRAAGITYVGAADVGECLVTARAAARGGLDGWYDAWSELAQRSYEAAEGALASGDRVSARGAFQRASTYYRTAGGMLLAAPIDERLRQSLRKQTDAFQRAAELFGFPVEQVEIPFEGGSLPGYFLRPSDDGAARATIILVDGYDGTMEETVFLSGLTSVEHGYNVLAFDGPGQGAVLVERGVPLRPDWEAVISPAVDWLEQRSDVDDARIALHGASLGGYLAPRAATKEHRIAALVADSGPYDIFEVSLARLPGPLAGAIRSRNRIGSDLVERMMESVEKKDTAGWALRRNLLVHGVADPLAFFEDARRYSLEGIADQISCPTWVCNAENDDITVFTPKLVAALTVPHEFVHFTAAEGADQHCEVGARSLYHSRSLGWLDALLEPGRLG